MTPGELVQVYKGIPVHEREKWLESHVKEEWREHVKVRGDKSLLLRAIDRHARSQRRKPLPFVMSMSPNGEFPKWMWDSLDKGHSPIGKVIF